jgi:hypothetical protein
LAFLLSPFFYFYGEKQMTNKIKVFFLLLITMLILSFNAYSQNINDDYYEDEDYYEPNWKNLFFDLGYGSGGVGGALGFRYYFIGVSLGVTGFANNIPDAGYFVPTTEEFEYKNYPSNSVFGDVYYFYDFEDFTLFANVGYFSSVDSVMKYYYEDKAYQKHGIEEDSGLTWGFGVNKSLYFLNEENERFDQLLAGVGYQSEMGIYLQITYRWE